MKTRITSRLLVALMCLSVGHAWALRRDANGYYLIESPQDLTDFSAMVNAGNTAINALVTDDIDMGAVENFPPIGTQTINYAGTFDGDGHTISNLTVASNGMFVGLFGSVTSGAVVKNLTLRNAQFSGQRFVAFIGAAVGSGTVTLERLGFEGKATAAAKDAAGMVGAMSGPTFTLTHCYVTGTITAGAEAAAITGYSNTGANTFIDCWSSAEITGYDTGAPFYRGSATLRNCYDKYGLQTTLFSNDALASGEFCFLLNGDQSEIIWHQTLGQDATPVLDASHARVYSSAPRRCDGQTLGEGSYTNDASQASTIPPHQFENGVCTVCGQRDANYMKPDAEGFCHIGSSSDLEWFAQLVNGGQSELKGRLVADIDMSAVENFTPIGTQALNFAGEFDGQGHVIRNLTSSGQYFVGLFGCVTGGAFIHDFTLRNTSLSGARFVGIAGAGLGSGQVVMECLGIEGQVRATDKGAAGIVGSMSGPVFAVRNCYVKGSISAPTEAEAITSYSNNGGSAFTNCWSTATITGAESGAPFYRGSAQLTNCYDPYGQQTNQLSEALLSGGALCYSLNGDQSQMVWYQTLGQDDTPLLESSHATVYTTAPKRCDGQVIGEGTYTNDASQSSVAPEHTYLDGVCIVCGQKDPGFMVVDDEGYYNISDAQQLAWFATAVNNGEADLKARLTADIDMSSVTNFAPIGSATVYFKGTFDGQSHSIKNLHITSEGMYVGLFGCVTGGAVIRDFTLKNAQLTGNRFVATIGAGMGEGSIVMERVGFEGQATATFKDASGLVGAMTGPVFSITDCYVVGTITAGAEAAAITGYSNTGATTFTNCWSSAEIVGNEEGHPFYRGSARVTNCFNQYALQAAELTESFLASGELCFGLNGDQRNMVWFQTLGQDATPVLESTHAKVYTTAPLRCDGQRTGEGTFTNDASHGSTVPEHQFESGICKMCGKMEVDFMEPGEDGFYNIDSGGQLVWFAQAVNKGEPNLKARLTADIDMADLSTFFQPIGTQSVNYAGTFDGQSHVIRNLTLESDQMYIGLFGCVTGGAVIKNLTLQNAQLTGQRFVGLIGAGIGSGFVTLDRLGFEGSSTATNRTAAGIVGVMSGPTFAVSNCYVVGQVTAESEAASMTGYSSQQQTTFTNCWSLAELTGVDGYYSFFRGNGIFINCYDQIGTQVTKVDGNQLSSGEFCYQLNGESFATPVWYQTLIEDAYPVLDASHGIVYMLDDAIGDVHDDATFTEFQALFLAAEQEYCNTVVAEQALIDQYADILAAVGEYQGMKEFCDDFGKFENAKRRIESSAKAYAAFRAKVEATNAYLQENSQFEGEKRSLLEDYLQMSEEPSELFPYGTAPYILETHLLTESQVKAETDKIDQMLKEAIAEDYKAHADITTLLANADFSKGYNGWSGTPGNRVGSPNAECRNSTCDFYQTLTGLKNGIYEIRVDGFFRPGNPTASEGNIESTNYGAMLYVNDVQNYFMASIEGMISINDAVDGENCYLTNNGQSEQTDYVVYGDLEDPIGYVPNSMTGLNYAVKGGRYANRVLANVTDGTLTVGFRMPGTGIANDCMDIANVQLFYHGTMEEATAELGATLECMAARAKTLCEYKPSDMTDYAQYPSFDASLRNGLQAVIDAIPSTTDPAQKYALVEQFSDLFSQIYESKKRYIGILERAGDMEDILINITDLLNDDETEELFFALLDIHDAYMAGTATDEMIDQIYNNVQFMPKKVDDAYEISSHTQLAVFALLVNNGESAANARLVADIDMAPCGTTVFKPIGTANVYYAGIFDGQGHTISNLSIENEELYMGLFGTVTGGAVIRNFTLKNVNLHAYRFLGIIGAGMGSGRVVLDRLGLEGTLDTTNKGAAGIIGVMSGPVFTVTDCYSTGTISASAEAAGITGYSNSSASSLANCWSSAELTGHEEGHPFYRGALGLSNCYNTFGQQATLLTDEMLRSGELCHLLNAGRSETVWYQTLGVDAHPVLDATHGVVVKNDDGTYGNATGINEMTTDNSQRTTDVIYDLTGRRVEKAVKGIYIINGKKVLR